MAATYTKPPRPTTSWLRPGQRFRATDDSISGTPGELTVARLVQDRIGLTHAILRDGSGREFSTYADQIQFAIEVGMLSPLEFVAAGPAC